MTAAGGDSRANYLLKWEAIRTSREQGATSYDLWGLATGGIAHFKTGFGGREVQYIGAWDLVLDPLGRQVYGAAQAGPRPDRAAASRAERRGLGVGVRGGRRGRRRVTETLRDRDPWPVEGPVRVEREPPPAWDEHTVDQPNGHVYQSLEWAAHRAASGWLPRYIVEPGGPGVLALLRPWPQIGGFSAYVPRGPISTGSPDDDAARLVEVAALLEAEGVDVVAADGEVPATPDYADALAAGRLPPDRGDPAVAPPDVAAARGRRRGVGVRRASRSRPGSGSARPSRAASSSSATTRGWGGAGWGRASAAPQEPTPVALDRFYDLLLETGERRHFSFGPRSSFVGWWTAAQRAGHLVLPRGAGTRRLPARRAPPVPPRPAADDRPQRRPRGGPARPSRARSTCSAGGRSSSRSARDATRWTSAASTWPGRDANRARATPTFGLYQHKKSFGAEWVELAGAHEKVIRRQPLPGRPGDVEAVAAARPAAGRRRDRRPGRVERGVTAVATIDALLAAAEPREPRPLGSLVERLTARLGAVGARDGGKAIGPAALGPVEVRGLSDDTRRLRPGSLFVAIEGEHVDGHDLLREAAVGGAAAALVERAVPDSPLPQIVVASTRAALAEAASWWYGDPQPRAGHRRHHRHGRQDDDVVPRRGGARGRRSLDRAHRDRRDEGRRAARGPRRAPDDARRAGPPAGAAGDGRRGQPGRGPRDDLARPRRRTASGPSPTTPRSSRTSATSTSSSTARGRRTATPSCRCSSASRRRRPTRRRATRRPAWPRTAVINADDPIGRRVRRRRPGGRCRDRHVRRRRARRRPAHPGRGGRPAAARRATRAAPAPPTLEIRLAGRFNAYNALAVVALGEGLGLDAAAIRAGLESVERVPGRMETVDAGQPFGVVVDFAHTPGVAPGGPRHPRAGRGGPRRRADRGVRVGGGAGHRQAADDGPDRRRAGAARRRHRRGPPQRGPRGDPRADRGRGRGRRPAAGPGPAAHRATGRRRSRRRSSGPVPATSCCSRARATRRRSSAPAGRSRTTSGGRPRRRSRRWATRRAEPCAAV